VPYKDVGRSSKFIQPYIIKQRCVSPAVHLAKVMFRFEKKFIYTGYLVGVFTDELREKIRVRGGEYQSISQSVSHCVG
jgi:plasmid replication initiation protein